MDQIGIDDEKQALIKKIAIDIVTLSRNTLFIAMRFLDVALFQFALNDDTKIKAICTNGEILYYNPGYIIRQYTREKTAVARALLHTVLHFVFKHPFVSANIDRAYWNLAVDITIENIIADCNLSQVTTVKDREQREYLLKLKQALPAITGEKVYRYLQDNNISKAQFDTLNQLFFRDDHSLWYLDSVKEEESPDEEKEAKKNKSDLDTQNKTGHDAPPDKEKNPGEKPENLDINLKAHWEDISERVKTDLETVSKEWGDKSGAFMQNILDVNRDRYDYAAILKKFAVLGEAMQINDEEFDYGYYTYGLNLYGNIPLIEPLEYKEVKRIKEFVIAVDTSASCAGETVQLFLEKTYSILKQAESFFRRINVHLIQCDAEVQSDYVITSPEDFDDYIKNMQIQGLGGTDFRPVFAHVDRLIQEGVFENLKGLIYFTDGKGVFPASKPAYQTAFVFLNEEVVQPEVPPWAVKLVLRPDDIKEIG